MRNRTKKVILLTLVILTALAAAVLLAAGRDGRGVARYYLWKATSPLAGKGGLADVNGIRLYYEVHGSGEPILLMHGGSASIECFYGIIPILARRFTVITPDSRAHGRSSDDGRPLSYSLMADDMLALLDRLHIGSAYVAGWSDGGVTGMAMAMRRPGSVRKLVTIGAYFRYDGLTPEDMELARTATPDHPLFADAKLLYRLLAPDPGRWDDFFRRLMAMWRTQPDFKRDELKRISIPVLVIAGENDMIRREHTGEMARLLPDARVLIVKGASHMVPLEQPERIAGEMIDFFTKP
jgi:pimeloyl-ACP methyl ester carboxylesterase